MTHQKVDADSESMGWTLKGPSHEDVEDFCLVNGGLETWEGIGALRAGA